MSRNGAGAGRLRTSTTTANANDAATDVNVAPPTMADLNMTASRAVAADRPGVRQCRRGKRQVRNRKLEARRDGQASSAAVKKFATKMISAHTASTAKLKSTLAGMSPADHPGRHAQRRPAGDARQPQGPERRAFDSAYAAAQVDAHQKTLDALNAYAASGDNAQLKTFASGLVPTVTAHLNMAKGLK